MQFRCLLLFQSCALLSAIDTTFSGNVDTNWSNPANWSNGVPSQADGAILNPNSNNPNLTAPSFADYLRITNVTTLNTSGPSLQLTSSTGNCIQFNAPCIFQTVNTFIVNSGTVFLAPGVNVNFNNSNLNPATNGIDLTITGDGALNLVSSSIATTGAKLGTLTLSGGIITASNNSDLGTDASSLRVTGGTHTLTYPAILGYLADNSLISGGSITVDGGNLCQECISATLSGGYVHNKYGYFMQRGSYVYLSGGTLLNEGDTAKFSNYVEISGGEIINQGVAEIGSFANSYRLLGGSITNYGDIGWFALSGTIQGGTITNYSRVAYQAGSVYLNGGTIVNMIGTASIANNASYVEINGLNVVVFQDFAIAQSAGSVNIINYHVINEGNVSNNLVDATFSYQFTNNGTAGVNCGTATINGSLTNTELFGNSSKIILNSGTVINQSGGLFGENSPLITLSSGSLTNASGGVFGENAVSILSSGALVTNSGAFAQGVPNMTLSAGAINNFGLIGPGITTLTQNAGDFINFSGGRIRTQTFQLNGGNLINDSGGIVAAPTINVSGAILTNSGNFGSNNTINISSGAITNNPSGSMGTSGVINLSNITISNQGVLGNLGNITVNSGGINNSGAVGNGASMITLSGGNISNQSLAQFGNSALIDSTGALIVNSGELGTSATITISGGALTNNLGGIAGSSASITISNIVVSNSGDLGRNSTLSLNSGGLDNYGSLGASAQGINLQGGAVNNFVSGVLGDSATVTNQSSQIINQGVFAPSATLNLLGGTLTNALGGTIGTATIILSGGSLTNNGLIVANNGTFSGGTFNGAGNLLLTGTSTISMPITEANIYVGTVGDAGTLFAFNTLNANVSVASNSALIGTLSMTNLNMDGKLYAGIAAAAGNLGTITVTNNDTLSNTSQLYMDLSGTYSDLISSGTLTLAPGASLILYGINLPVATTTTWTIGSMTNRVGTFTNVTYPTGFSGTFSMSYGTNTIQVTAAVGVAGSTSWTNSSGDYSWQTASNWSDFAIPNCYDQLYFNTTSPGGTTIQGGTIYLNGTAFGNTLSFFDQANNFVFERGTPFEKGTMYLHASTGTLSGDIPPVTSAITVVGNQTFNVPVYIRQSATISNFGTLNLQELRLDPSACAPGVSFGTLTLLGTGTYNFNGSIGLGAYLIDLSSQNIFNATGSKIGPDVTTLDFTNASISNSGIIGDNASNITFSGGTLISGPASVIGRGAGTISFSNLELTIPLGAEVAGTLTTLLQFQSGTLTNAGSIGHLAQGTLSINGGSISNSGDFGYGAFAVNITSDTARFTNTFNLGNNATVNLSNGNFINSGTVGNLASMLNVSGASITNSGQFGKSANLNFSSGTFTILPLSKVGESAVISFGTMSITNPSSAEFAKTAQAFNMSSGTFTNNGVLGFGATASFIGGTIINNTDAFEEGRLALNGSALLNNQGTVGLGASLTTSDLSTFINNGTSFSNGTINLTGGSIFNQSSKHFGLFAATLSLNGADLTNQGWLGGSAAYLELISGTLSTSPGSFVGNNATAISLNGLNFINATGAEIGTKAKIFKLQAGSITNNGSMANTAKSLEISGGFLTASSGSEMASEAFEVVISNGQVFVNSGAKFGYEAGTVTITGGSITNAGSFGHGGTTHVIISGGWFVNTSNLGSEEQNQLITNPLVMVLKTSDQEILEPLKTQDFSKELIAFSAPIKTSNEAQVAKALNTLNGNCPPPTQFVINELLTLNQDQKLAAMKELGPIFKIAQFSLEKLDLLLHRELESALYQNKTSSTFVIGGYDQLNQSKQSDHIGYTVSSFYQLLGANFKRSSTNYLVGLGAAESFMRLKGANAHAHYNTVYASMGSAYTKRRLSLGLDGLFGYSFFDGSRKISFLNLKAHNHHGIYNVSFEGKASYNFGLKKLHLEAFEQLGYLYGQESRYNEKGAPGVNLKVFNENISVLRNTLGLYFASQDKPSLKLFASLAWLYEYYTNNNAYKAGIIGTNVYESFNQALPCKNYAWLKAGITGSYNHFDWQLSYTGLFGHLYMENSFSARLGYKF